MKHALQELASYLKEHGKILGDYSLPEPASFSTEVEHELERWYLQLSVLHDHANNAFARLNSEQRAIFYTIIDGKAGWEKTFLVNAICNYLHTHELIVLPTATSDYAAQL